MTAATTKQLDAEIAARKAADAVNLTAIGAEGKARAAGDKIALDAIVALAARVARLEESMGNTSPIAPPPLVSGVYGQAMGWDSLNNSIIGDHGGHVTRASYRFRAEQSSALSSIRVYIIGAASGAGYGGGDNGIFTVTVQTDDGSADHHPSGTVLATVVVDPVNDGFQTYTFSSPATLTAGTLYHIVFTNTDATPAVNYASVDGGYMWPSTVPFQPRYADLDWAQLISRDGGDWEPRGLWEIPDSSTTPIADLAYANGAHQGMGYIDCSIGSGGSNQGKVNGTSCMIRESFTVSGGNRIVSAISVRLGKTAGGTDPLSLRLETSGGAEIETRTIPAATFPDYVPGASGCKGGWGTATFVSPHVLTSGQSYNIRLSTAAGTTFTMTPVRDGSTNGFNAATHFSDGLAWKTVDSVNWTHLGATNQEHLQFYFVTA